MQAAKSGTIVLLAGIGSWGIAPAVTGSAATTSGGAALLYTPTGIAIGGQTVLGAGGYLCTTGELANPPNDLGSPPCNLSSGTNLEPLADVNLLTERADNGTTANSASSKSQVASVRIGPDQVPAANCGAGTGSTPCDLIDATLLTAQTSADCTNGLRASSSIATLTIAGNSVLTGGEVPANTEIPLSAGTEAQTLASVILNFERPPFAEAPNTSGGFLPPSALPANEAQASPVVVNFPQGGALAPLVTGTLFVSYAQSDITGCSAPNPSPSPMASPGASPSPSASPSASPSPAASPSATPTPQPSASASPCAGTDSDDSQEDQHESAQAQAHENCNDEAQEECHESTQAELHENDGHAHDATPTCPETSTGATPAGLVLTPRNDIGLVAFALLLLLAALGWRPRVKIGWKR